MSGLKDALKNIFTEGVFPFFWQNGADEGTLTTELSKIYFSNIRTICVESRSHPDFSGPKWWHDMDIIMQFAREHDMGVYLLDDDRFPTGHANKAFQDGNNPHSVRFLTVHGTDVMGPFKGTHMLAAPILHGDDEWIGAYAFPRKSGETYELDFEKGVFLDNFIENGWLDWDVPDGLWKVLIFYTTRCGNGKLDYFNILDPESVKILIDRVYKPHYEHYGKDFGKTFIGFFSDEPEFSNLPGYDFQAKLGLNMPFIPWSADLKNNLEKRWKDKFLRNLAALWYPCGSQTSHIRYDYMDETTKLVRTSFGLQIQEWCEEHNVVHIGHVLEDDNSHGRLGCGLGHYFRAVAGMRMAGIDVVTQQIMPQMDQMIHQWVASDKDGEFFHYGLAKMGSSAGHIDPYKKGDSLCEIFGAFGWQEGIRLMKWLTDHMVSRGINHFTPHAFSMKPYPDPDCPPHFYAHGNQAEYEHFGLLMTYIQRLTALYSGGVYAAEVAVLYHAEAEWTGEDVMLFQKPVRELMEHQIECDIVPAEIFDFGSGNAEIMLDQKGYGLKCGQTIYRVLIIPGCRYLPKSIAELMKRYKEFPVLFVGTRPSDICESVPEKDNAEYMKEMKKRLCIPLSGISDAVKEIINPIVSISQYEPHLRLFPYRMSDGNYSVFSFNEGAEGISFGLNINAISRGCRRYVYNIQHGCLYEDEGEVTLAPGQSKVFIYLQPEEQKIYKEYMIVPKKPSKKIILDGTYEISFRDVKKREWVKLLETKPAEGLPDLTKWAEKEKVNGWIRYSTHFECEDDVSRMSLSGWIDGEDIYIDGMLQDRVIGNTDEIFLHAGKGTHVLDIRIPLTPVFESGDLWSCLTFLPGIGLSGYPEIS